jgi:hypothetical protein
MQEAGLSLANIGRLARTNLKLDVPTQRIPLTLKMVETGQVGLLLNESVHYF